MTKYYCAHARGCDFKNLRAKGFVVLYPEVDDYVFLAVKPENEKLLRKQSELGIYFLREGEKYTQVSPDEITRMKKNPVGPKLDVGSSVFVVEGAAANLEGIVEKIDEAGRRFFCKLKGLTREYSVWLDRLEIVEHSPA